MEFPRVSIKRQNEAITQSGGMEMFSPVEEFAQQIARSTDAAITSCLATSRLAEQNMNRLVEIMLIILPYFRLPD